MNDVAHTVHARERRPRQGAVIGVLAGAGLVASLMQTLLIPIQAELPRLLDAPRDTTAWVVTVTLLVSAVCTPIAGRLGDMYGKRRVALALLGLLALGSIVCALAPGLEAMIAGRALQGCGAGVIALGISILRDTVEPKRLGSAVALVSATLGVGGAIGLPLAALVAQHADWKMLFWMSAALSGVALAAVAAVVPESELRTGGRLDVVGAIGLAIGLTGVLLALSKGNEWGWLSPWTMISAIGGAIVLGLWTWFELRAARPLVDIRVNARRSVLLTNVASIAMGFALFTSSIAFPQLLQLPASLGGFGLPLFEASLVLVPAGLAMLAMSPVSGRLMRVHGPRPLLVVGAAVLAIVYLGAIVVPLSIAAVLVLNGLLGVGIGLAYASMPSLIMRAVPAGETAAANGLNTLMRGFGTAVAAAVIAAVLAQGSAHEPSGLPAASTFDSAFALGLGAAVLAGVTALLIPRGKRD